MGWHKNAQSGWSLKTEKIRINNMYTLHIFIQYGISSWHELAYTLHYILIKLNWNICGTSAYFLLIWLALLIWTVLRRISCLNQTWIKNKIKLACGSHIYLHTTYNLIVSTYKHMYANPLTSVVSIQICHPSYQAAQINNHGTGYYSRYRINNLRVLYVILCTMRGWYDE